MPEKMAIDVKKEIKEGKYASVSEFFRDAFRAWKENQFYNDIMESEKEFAQGKGRVLKSLKDLR